MIGGTDIVIPASGDAAALDDCIRMIQYYWPDARFENAITGEKYPSYVDIPFGLTEELFVYRDANSQAAWDADSDNSPLNSMLYVLLSPDSVTVVVDDPDAHNMREMLQSIQSMLSDCNIYAEAA